MSAVTRPGRVCPLHYRYPPGALTRKPVIVADTLYVIGGLYGNRPALAAIEQLAAAEAQPVTMVFNGDFNWFNIDPAGFAAINTAALAHHALRGNVETELADDDDAAGCGCGYPESVSDAEVERSNAIMAQLRTTARLQPGLRQRLGALPMTLNADVGGVHVAIVHGDCDSLAGWRYDESALRNPGGIAAAAADCAATGARVIASSHTCLPVAVRVDTPAGACALFNNGAAGMPNFAGTRFGLITRIAISPATTPAALYGTNIDGIHVDALAVAYDHAQWQSEFSANWPGGSAAHLSYHQRIAGGPGYGINQAMRQGIRISTPLRKQLLATGGIPS